MRPAVLLPLLATACLLALGLNLATGAGGFQPDFAWQGIAGKDSLASQVVLELRLPRATLALSCGALLAIAGALLQALLRNPLADPYVLGVSGGAGAGAMLAMLVGAGAAGLAAAGLAGAAFSLALILAIGYRTGFLPARLLLAGVILAAAWGAVTTLLLALAPDAPLRGMVFWLMGDLAGATPGAIMPAGALVALVAALPFARPLDALARGDLAAASLGVAVTPVRTAVLCICAAATATVVVSAGSIGFVGLVTPHLVRLSGVRRHVWLLPASALAGSALLLLADLAARTLVAPRQLPVGAITALVGAPLFLLLLVRSTPRPS